MRTPVPDKGTGGFPWASLADAHLKRKASRSVARDGLRSAAVVAVTKDRLDGFALLTRTFGTWEWILGVSWMADTGVLTGDAGSGYR